MSFYLAQGGTSLYKIDPVTGVPTALTLPSGITLDTTRKPKFAVLNQWVVVVNSPNRNLAIDPEGVVRVLVPRAPQQPPNVAVGASTGLTGTYQYRVSFFVNGSDDELFMESPLSPLSAQLTVANQDIALTRIPISEDSITGRRIYRNATAGTQFYKLIDLEGNIGTTLADALADASLATLPVVPTTLQSPPGTIEGTRLKNITAWKNRLWGCTDSPVDVDTIYYTDDNKVYAWGYRLVAYPQGQDQEGVVAFAPRRDQLGILKRDGLWQITGTSNSNFQIVQIAFGKAGCIAPDSVVVVNDVVYWLGKDGIYEWGGDGSNTVRNISEDAVDPWFTSDTYFTRSRFANCFARYNQVRDSVEFHLANLGSSVEDRWITYNRRTKKWYGPHLTSAFTPSHAGLVFDNNAGPVSLVGASNGIIYTANSNTLTDGTATAIDMDCYGPFHSADAPDIEHAWLQLSVLTKIESGGTLDVIPYVGRLNASAGTTISHDLTKGRELLRRLGTGPMLRLRFRQNTNLQNATIFGYEIPLFEVGRR